MRRALALALLLLPFAAEATNRTGVGRLRIPAIGGVRTLGFTSNLPLANKTACRNGVSDGCTFAATTAGLTSFWGSAQPGDVLELQARTVTSPSFAGAELWDAYSSCSGASGTSPAPIRVRVRAGDNIKLYTETPNNETYGLLTWQGCNFVIVESGLPGMGNLFVGDATKYLVSNPLHAYANNHTMIVNNSTNLRLTGINYAGANDYTAIIISRSSRYLMFDRSTFDAHGVNDLRPSDAAGTLQNSCTTNPQPCSTPKQDSGNNFQNYGWYTVVQDSSFKHPGHSAMTADGPWQIYRRNDFSGDDRDLATGSPGNHAATFENNRNQSVSTWPWPAEGPTYGPTLVEDNYFHDANLAADSAGFSESFKLLANHAIVRSNYIVDTFSGPIMSVCSTVDTTAHSALYETGPTVYNNTTFNNGALVYSNAFGWTTGVDQRMCEKMIYINNLVQGVTPNLPSTQPWVVSWRVTVNANIWPQGSYANAFKGGYIGGNVFGAHPTTPTQNMQVRVTASVNGTGGLTIPVTDCTSMVDATVPNGHSVCDNQNVVLNFANGTSNPTRSKAGLALAPNAPLGLGDARPLTSTSDAGTGDTALVLVNSKPFKGAWGFAGVTWGGYWREDPDCMCVSATSGGSPNACQVTQIVGDPNYLTGAVTVSPGVTHVAGSGVWKVTTNPDGTCGAVWKNRGAVQ